MSSHSLEYAQQKAQCIKEIVPEYNRSGTTILDVGCGSGAMTYYVQEVFFEAKVIGVDTSQEAIAQAREQYPTVEFNCLKNNQIHFSKNYFDLIIVADLLHHMPKSTHSAFLKQLMHVLKPDGRLLILELNPWNIFTYFSFKKNPVEHNAQLLSCWYVKRILQPFGRPTIHCCIVLHWFTHFVWWLIKIPLSSFYAVQVQKN